MRVAGDASLAQLQRERLRTLLAEVLPRNRFYARKFAGVQKRGRDPLNAGVPSPFSDPHPPEVATAAETSP